MEGAVFGTLGQEVGIVVYSVLISEKEWPIFLKQNRRVRLYIPTILWGPLKFGCAAILMKFCLNILAYVRIV